MIYIELGVTNLLQTTPKTGVFTKKVTNVCDHCKLYDGRLSDSRRSACLLGIRSH